MTILAIDQSTSSTSAFLVDNSGDDQIIKTIAHRQHYPTAGWVEHDAEELLANIQSCINDAGTVDAIGIDNQGESCLAWDAESKRAISPVIVWQDNRTRTTIDNLKNENVEQLIQEKAGLPLDSYFSASKLAWIINNIPEAKALLKKGTLRLGTTDAFFLDRLTGRFVTDISTASRTSLMNLKTGSWDEELCNLFDVPIEALPVIVATTGDFGSIRSGKQNIPITASIVDQQAALYGHGCTSCGETKITFGTGAFALTNTGEIPRSTPQQKLLPTVAWQLNGKNPIYALDGGVYAAGAAINWAKSLGLFQSYAQIGQFNTTSAIEKDLVFVPALAGLGCPHWDRTAGGLWIGLSLDTQPIDMVQSILEGIVFRTAEVINTMNDVIQIKNEISIDGGVSENPYFCQFLADVLARDIVVKSSADLTAFGVAQLAAHQLGSPIVNKVHGIRYAPKKDRRNQCEKFSSAVSRSTGWKL